MTQAVHVLMNNVQAANTTGDVCSPGDRLAKVVEAFLTGSGTVGATIEIYGNTRNNTTDGILIATITLNGTAPQRDGFAFDAPWPFVYARIPVGGLTGTGAAVTVDLAV